MGTSSSRRSPQSAAWRLLNRQIEQGIPAEALSRSLFRAADSEWRELLSGPGVRLFAQRAAALWSALPEHLSGHERASQALAEVAREVRVDAIGQGHVSQAVPLAERALYRALLGPLREGPVSSAELTPDEAGERWTAQRPSTSEALAQRFLAEALRETAVFIVSRDSPQHLGKGAAPNVLATAELEDRVGGIAASAAYAVTLTSIDPQGWAAAVRAAFANGAGRAQAGGTP